MINIDELTVGQLKELRGMLGEQTTSTSQQLHPYEIGRVHFVRTVTHHFTGRLVAVFPQELVFEDAAWIADDGRFAGAVESGEFNEVEPFPKSSKIIIGRGSLIDCFAASWKAPSSQK